MIEFPTSPIICCCTTLKKTTAYTSSQKLLNKPAMYAVILWLLQSRKFWWYLLLLHDVIVTSYCCQRYAECLATTLFQQHSAPAHRAAHVQQLNCSIRNAKHSGARLVASQCCGLWDLGCHAALCLPQTNPWCGWIETAAHQCLVRSWTVDFWWGYWPVARKTSSVCLC